MQGSGWVRRAVLVVGVTGLAAALTGCTPAQPTIIKSKWETAAPNRDYARDGGYSARLPDLPQFAGQSMWLWGDTVINGFYVPGTFASIGSSTVDPVPDVSEVPTPGVYPADGPDIVPGNTNGTQWFLPNPTGLLLPGGDVACGNPDPTQGIEGSLAIRWPLGIARGPGGGAQITLNGTPRTAAHLMFVAYLDVCLIDNVGDPPIAFLPQRMGLAVHDPVANQILTLTTLFETTDGSFLPWQLGLFHPTFVGSEVYFYAVCNPAPTEFGDACPDATGVVGQARVPFAGILDDSQYTWRTASGWSGNPADATTIVPVDAAHPPWSVYVGDYSNVGRGWLMVVGTSGDGDVRVYQAPSANGPWTMKVEGKMPGCPEYSDPTLLKCYHLWGHPELSTTSDQIFSYHAQHPNGGEAETYVVSLGNFIPPL